MLWLILMIVLLIVALVLLSGALNLPEREERYGRETLSVPGVSLRKFAAIPFGLALVVFAFTCFVTVKGTEVAVPISYGSIGDPMDNGLHMKAPWTNVNKFSTTRQVIERDILLTGSDGVTNTATVRTTYAIVLEDAAEGIECDVTNVFRVIRTEDKLEALVVANYLERDLRAAFQQVTGFEGYTSKQGEAVRNAEATLRLVYAENCIRLDSILITGMVPSDKVQQAVDATAQADVARTKAQGEADAAKTVAEGNKAAAILESEGRKEAAQNDADANATVQSSLTPEALLKQYIEMLERTGNKVILIPTGEGGTPLISIAP